MSSSLRCPGSNSTTMIALHMSRSTRRTPGVCASTSANELSLAGGASSIRYARRTQAPAIRLDGFSEIAQSLSRRILLRVGPAC